MAAEVEAPRPVLNLNLDPNKFQPQLNPLTPSPLTPPASLSPQAKKDDKSDKTGAYLAPMLREANTAEDSSGAVRSGFLNRSEFGIQLRSNF
jgi:hypothetical protein